MTFYDAMSDFRKIDPERWLDSVFAAKAVGQGRVIHRAVRDVERFANRALFVAEVRKRGFTLVENGGQFVVFCNREPVRLVVERDPPLLSERAYPAMPAFRSDPSNASAHS